MAGNITVTPDRRLHVLVRPIELKAAAHHCLDVWVRATFAAACGMRGDTVVVSREGERTRVDHRPAMAPDQARAALDHLLHLCARARRHPLPFGPKTSFAVFAAGQRGVSETDRAMQAWHQQPQGPPGEGDSASARLTWRDRDPFAEEIFDEWRRVAAAVFGPVEAWFATTVTPVAARGRRWLISTCAPLTCSPACRSLKPARGLGKPGPSRIWSLDCWWTESSTASAICSWSRLPRTRPANWVNRPAASWRPWSGMPMPAPSPAEHQPGIRLLLDRLAALPDAARHTAVLRLRLALDESDQLAVSTIHAFCKQVLGAEGFLCGMPAGFEVLPDPGDAQSDAIKDTWRTDLGADSLLAAVAACETWSVEDDLKAWRSLTRRPATRMEPEPLSLQDARDRVAQALEALQARRADIRQLQEIASRDAVRLNRSAQKPGEDSVAQLDTWHTTLETLDPQQLPADMFHIATRLAGATSWFGRKGAAGRVASDEAGALPIVAAARSGGGEPRRDRVGVAGAPQSGRWGPLCAQPAPQQRRHLRRIDSALASRAVYGAQPRGARPAAGGQVDGGPD